MNTRNLHHFKSYFIFHSKITLLQSMLIIAMIGIALKAIFNIFLY